MPSSYLTSNDFAAYGLPATTTAALISQASAAVDLYLARPEGLVWLPDASGIPAYMAALTPAMTYQITGAVQPGSNLQVAVTPAMATDSLIGEVLILDRATSTGTGTNVCEAVVVASVQGVGTITLQSVAFPHAPGCTADAGLVITEDRKLPAKRAIARISRPNALRIVSIQGRYGYGRRDAQQEGIFEEFNLLSTVRQFGRIPIWQYIDPTQVDVSPVTGEMWVPAGVFLAYYSELRVRYIAGFSAANIPTPIKMATAQIATTIAGLAGVPATVSRISAGDTTILRNVATNLDPDTKRSIESFKARVYY